MATEIYVGTRKERVNERGGVEKWDEGPKCNKEQLEAELMALSLPGVRGFSVCGREDEVATVYVWDDAAPVGEYHPLEVTPEIDAAVRDGIRKHIPKPPVDPDEELMAAVEAATTLDQLKAALLGRTRKGAAAGRPTK